MTVKLPQFHGGVPMTDGDKRRLRLWTVRAEWTKRKSREHLFKFEESMPMNRTAPEVPESATFEASSKYVCVMCGYVTSVTNLCRSCREMPADQEMTVPVFCYAHGTGEGESRIPTYHYRIKEGKRVYTDHEGIAMVCVASVQQRLDEETGDSRDILVKSLVLQASRRKK